MKHFLAADQQLKENFQSRISLGGNTDHCDLFDGIIPVGRERKLGGFFRS